MQFGIPVIEEIVVVYDEAIVAKMRGASRGNIIGNYNDFVNLWQCLLSSAGLTTLEWITAQSMFAAKIGYWFGSNSSCFASFMVHSGAREEYR